ncbi:MAG: heme exporter protein CcmB [Chloroflexota bacterium]|nr:heme exporter protein CcmB [Chloroflexota bacterium]
MIFRAMLVARRELSVERSQPDGVVTALTFTLTVVLLESLAFGAGRAQASDIASGLYWIALLFAAVLTATRSFDRDLEDDAIDAVIALPGGRDALFAGKAVALGVILALVGGVAGAFAIFLLDLAPALPVHLLVVAALGVIALPPVIVLSSLLALRVRARAAIVPILTFPLLTPQLVAATQGTAAALDGRGAEALAWAGLLAAFALVYTVLGLTIVPAAIE